MSSFPLLDLIRRDIAVSGSMRIDSYMALCLAHPQYGYYVTRDPLGTAGDFTTAPEISQLFGEMVGIWAVENWRKLGAPARVILCECGPGRGTLMADILRVAAKFPEFAAAAEIHLVETSPALRVKQRDLLGNIVHHVDTSSLPHDAPLILIANEFFDALPFRQAIFHAGEWRERVIGDDNGVLTFGLGGRLPGIDADDVADGAIHEFSPLRDAVWRDICDRIKTQTGAALVVDYGFTEVSRRDTFQAVRAHRYTDVLRDPGDSDLTSHVDFVRLADLAAALTVQGPMTQGEFLKNYGIELRARNLAACNPEKSEAIIAGLDRLIASDQMGELFKVIAIASFSGEPMIFA